MTSIIIVTHNSSATIVDLINSLQKHVPSEYEIIVVDNASTDDTVKRLEEFDSIKVVQERHNTGFAAACTKGVQSAEGEYYLFLNPDALFIEDALTSIVQKFVNEKIAVIGVKLLHRDGTLQPSVRTFPTLLSQLLIVFKLHHITKSIPALKRYYAADFDYAQEQSVDQVMGAYFLTTRAVWKKLGGFDTRFFIWFEEVDYCYRAKQAGYEVIYTPDQAVIHSLGHSFSQEHFVKKQWWFIRSMLQYFGKRRHETANR